MKALTVYLAGPINGCTDAEMSDWREDARRRLTGHVILDPTVRDYRGAESENITDIVEGDKADIDSADAVIAYCPKPSVGTSMEVLHAWQSGKPVYVVAPHGAPVSPWLAYHSAGVFQHMLEVPSAILRDTQKIGLRQP